MEVVDDSRQLAHESRRDGSSMKTIAVLTMLFLPAIFFSTLFSMTSFDDTQPDVLTGMCWACTVSVTMAVFILWAAITQREAIRVLSRTLREVLTGRRTRRTRKSESSNGSYLTSFHSSQASATSVLSSTRPTNQENSSHRGTSQSIRKYNRDEEAGSCEGTC